MEIPFHKPYISEDEISEVVDTLRTGWITMGPKTVRFEESFGHYVGSRYAVAVNSGTAALHLALEAVEVRSGEEVIIPTMTFTATGEVVTYCRARPVLVDVDRETHNLEASAVEKAVTRKTKAILPVHFAGQPCDLDAIREVATQHRLMIVEDAAHALPAAYRERRIGGIGDITCFSFYSTKPLTTGEGGMATTDNEAWADRMRILRLHGISKDAWKRYSKGGSWYYEVLEAGYKYNMTDLQAALGIAQLRKVEWLWEKRKEIARRYTEAFKVREEIITPVIRSDRETAWHLYVIKLRLETLTIGRDAFIERLKEKGIETSVHFIPLHRQPYYRKTYGLDARDFPNAEWIYARSISLPLYPGMTEEEVQYVIDHVIEVAQKYKK